MLNHLNSRINSSSKSNHYHSAYRKFYSSEIALLKIHNDILSSINAGKVNVLALLDLSSAFDAIFLRRLDDWFWFTGNHLTSLNGIRLKGFRGLTWTTVRFPNLISQVESFEDDGLYRDLDNCYYNSLLSPIADTPNFNKFRIDCSTSWQGHIFLLAVFYCCFHSLVTSKNVSWKTACSSSPNACPITPIPRLKQGSLCQSDDQDRRRCESLLLSLPFSPKQPPPHRAVCLYNHFSCNYQKTSQEISLWLGLHPHGHHQAWWSVAGIELLRRSCFWTLIQLSRLVATGILALQKLIDWLYSECTVYSNGIDCLQVGTSKR